MVRARRLCLGEGWPGQPGLGTVSRRVCRCSPPECVPRLPTPLGRAGARAHAPTCESSILGDGGRGGVVTDTDRTPLFFRCEGHPVRFLLGMALLLLVWCLCPGSAGLPAPLSPRNKAAGLCNGLFCISRCRHLRWQLKGVLWPSVRLLSLEMVSPLSETAPGTSLPSLSALAASWLWRLRRSHWGAVRGPVWPGRRPGPKREEP